MFVWMYDNCLYCLTVYTEASVVLPLGLLDADLDHQNSGTLDAAVSGFHQCDGNPTKYIPSCMGLGLLPLGGEADGKVIQFDLRLCAQLAVD